MKLLFLTPQLPYPPQKGTTIRNYNLIRQLARRHEVHLLSFVQGEDDLAWVPELRQYCHSIDTVLAPQRSPLRRAWTVLSSPLPDMALRLPSAEYQTKLADLLEREEFDVVQIEGIEMAQYGLALAAGHQSPDSHRPCLVFDDHNAEYVLQKRAWEIDRRYPAKWHRALYSLIQWRKLQRYEAQVCQAMDAVVAVSAADCRALQRIVPGVAVAVVPNGVDSIRFALPIAGQPVGKDKIRHMASLVFTGTMDFRPNIDAVTWFCQAILPRIKKEVFHVHFYIVGKSPPPEVRRLGDNPAVTVTGYVEDIRPYIAQSLIYVVPMRMGSGTKLKVLQAMAMGTPVIATSTGAEGIEVTPGEDILIADEPADFAQQVIGLLNDAPLRQRLAQRGRQLMEAQYDWTSIAPRLEQVYEMAMTRYAAS
jgi:sugar transferase (PEP-CTERM/EpsH1 system associated)